MVSRRVLSRVRFRLVLPITTALPAASTASTVRPLNRAMYNSGSYTHYSFLCTMEDVFGINTYLGDAATALPINGIER